MRTDLRELQAQFEDALTFGPLLASLDDSANSEQVLAHNYRQLVQMLRNADSLEAKLRLLAMWLRQERILEPREFLSKSTRKKFVESTRSVFEKPKGRRLKAKPSELMYALIAEAWKPYLELMRTEYERLPPRRRTEPDRRLIELGFDVTAIDTALGATTTLRAPTDAACRFAAVHLNVDEDTVVVAHSKLFPASRRSS